MVVGGASPTDNYADCPCEGNSDYCEYVRGNCACVNDEEGVMKDI